MAGVEEKLAYFQAITGITDSDLCTEILSAHGWDLELAISSITGADGHRPSSSGAATTTNDTSISVNREPQDVGLVLPHNGNNGPPGLAWKIVTLPFSIISGSLGLISGAIGFGMWAAGGILSYSLGMVGLRTPVGAGTTPLASVSQSAAEAMGFVSSFERDYGRTRPNFVEEGFMDALQRSRREYKLLFVYLHSPEHPDTPAFCGRTLCNEVLTTFLNENFVTWGASVKASEGFKMSNSLKASGFPFCAVVMAATNQRIALLQQAEGPKSPEEILMLLQKVLEESAPVLDSARLEAEERTNSIRLREEQDAAYRAALEADQARERQRKEEQERLEREAAEAERKRKEEEEAHERALQEAAERESALAKMREEKALSLGAEPEKGPDVTQVFVRFPSGERKGRRFHCSTTIQSLYDYVDSLGFLEVDSYSLISNFPRTVYGQDKLSLSLQEAGLHPQASLFVELK
ncbi:putative regulator of the ubiquitin pathway (contains UAS and UBX domains) [Handroanthus impetiginosus]|uniref:Putative regulator of the ubiquitin pathway (Contains UAS and UBX domains) n=1 Tax=Handroanthus impetiginosus TaxID=429701 RepID=A0A2G9G580_9LAMI|nr:putative regulator of the ubiquitin pathway (contains UAS and UBX domains) [Handroanthus impetiginosus]